MHYLSDLSLEDNCKCDDCQQHKTNHNDDSERAKKVEAPSLRQHKSSSSYSIAKASPCCRSLQNRIFVRLVLSLSDRILVSILLRYYVEREQDKSSFRAQLLRLLHLDKSLRNRHLFLFFKHLHGATQVNTLFSDSLITGQVCVVDLEFESWELTRHLQIEFHAPVELAYTIR